MNMLHFGHFMQYQKSLTHAIVVLREAITVFSVDCAVQFETTVSI
jgi:hypothetical protein